jgi:regulator of protease activity HflC (stomatin/prohibitin superfamily)
MEILGFSVMALFSLFFFFVLVASTAVRIINEYERGVVFRLGRIAETKTAGLRFLIPIVDRMVRVDLRTVTLDIPAQEVITKDNVTIRVNAVVYFNVMDPVAAVIKVANHYVATSLFAQTTLRNVLGQHELDEVLAERDKISMAIQRILDEQTNAWGIKVSIVEIKDIELPEEMRRVMSKQAEAEREKRAKIIAAEGEFQASARLADAARVIETTQSALQLRYLQTLVEISAGKTNTILFPVPIDMLSGFIKKG